MYTLTVSSSFQLLVAIHCEFEQGSTVDTSIGQSNRYVGGWNVACHAIPGINTGAGEFASLNITLLSKVLIGSYFDNLEWLWYWWD